MAFRIGPPPHRSYWWGLAAILAAAGAMSVLYVADPVFANAHTLSEYIHQPRKWSFLGALLLLVFGSAVALIRTVRGRSLRGPCTRPLLALWTAGLATAAACPIDAGRPSPVGTVHNLASVIAFLSLPTVALIAGRHYRRHPEFWRPAALVRILGVVGFVAVTVFLVTFFGVSPQLVGATERIAVLVELCTLVVLLRWSCHPADSLAPAGPSRTRRCAD
ncbi:DUF998 domain-containing protein [Amycolatopsis vastitatis]|uniref:DUF998 domain-containing protein n=1 Tax=Amycolatopsis vastitatis TaxID=1905142 RepID=A0A229SZ33_9PSEU|nr:DUF998 domain-containing protein [Amycolatopsis vastitatis]OXM64043.1 hypothetical protein CF165_27220 [Amycolatopsis vastitatis]